MWPYWTVGVGDGALFEEVTPPRNERSRAPSCRIAGGLAWPFAGSWRSPWGARPRLNQTIRP